MNTTTEAESTSSKEFRRVLWSSYFGTAIEYYDFLLYGTASTLVFGTIFFSNLSPLVGTIASLGVFAVGYLGRPVGSIIFGHMGDRVGRKASLTITMILMGISTALIGLLPTPATIGAAAPILLVILRLLQGVGVGGEWGGGVLMTFEHAPPSKRGFATGVMYAGTPTGTLSAAVIFGLFALLPEHQFMSWGWRVPFLLSFGLIAVGVWIRLRIAESPLFLEEQRRQAASGERPKSPLLSVLRQPGRLIPAFLVIATPWVQTSLVNNLGILWATETGGLTRSQALIAQAAGALVNLPLGVYMGALGDRFGPIRVLGAGILACALYSYPFLLLMGSGSLWLAIVANMLAVVISSATFAPIGAFVSYIFPTSERYTGASIGYQLPASIVGGLAPVTLVALLGAGNGGLGFVILFVVGICVVSLIAAVYEMRRKRGAVPDGDPQPGSEPAVPGEGHAVTPRVETP